MQLCLVSPNPYLVASKIYSYVTIGNTLLCDELEIVRNARTKGLNLLSLKKADSLTMLAFPFTYGIRAAGAIHLSTQPSTG